MDKPNCRLCGKKHWKNEPCIFPESPKSKECQECKRKDEVIKSLLGQLKDDKPGFNRPEYMKNYMRKRRAQKSRT